jgi:hypothetical protein
MAYPTTCIVRGCERPVYACVYDPAMEFLLCKKHHPHAPTLWDEIAGAWKRWKARRWKQKAVEVGGVGAYYHEFEMGLPPTPSMRTRYVDGVKEIPNWILVPNSDIELPIYESFRLPGETDLEMLERHLKTNAGAAALRRETQWRS